MSAKNTMKVALVGAVFASVAFSVAAQTPDTPAQKQTPPPGGQPKAFNVPAHETYTLPNGMRVTLVPYGNIPKVDISLAVRAGNLNDPRGRAGSRGHYRRIVEGRHQDAERQSAGRNDRAEWAAAWTCEWARTRRSVDVDVLSEYGAAAIKLVADFAMHPLLPESELPRLKANLLRQVVVAKTRPGQIALARFRKLMYGDHPYGDILPTEDSLKKMTIEDARKFYADNYGAERAHLYVAGKFDVRR